MVSYSLTNSQKTPYAYYLMCFYSTASLLNGRELWGLFRKEKNIANVYQFYSLKDTGITDLLNSGVPAIKVRDQARHYDLKITEGYTARNKTCDETVRNCNFDF